MIVTKALIFLPMILASAMATGENSECYRDVHRACGVAPSGEITNCNAKYGHFHEVEKNLQKFANLLIATNFQFMSMSIHFKNYENHREGFAQLFMKYADKAWEDAIELTKYIAKRGGSMDFNYVDEIPSSSKPLVHEITEIHALSRALDTWKVIAETAHTIHREAIRNQETRHDPEVASFIENEYVHGHASIIRDLAGHVNDLKQMISTASPPSLSDASLALFLFDKNLK